MVYVTFSDLTPSKKLETWFKKVENRVFYNKKIEKCLLDWPSSLRAKLVRIFELIQKEGGDLGLPLTRAMGNGLFEIRVKGQNNIGRVFYCYIKRKEIIILHGFIKKTQKTPMKEIDIAKKRLIEVMNYEL